jgi:hypothetical protein
VHITGISLNVLDVRSCANSKGQGEEFAERASGAGLSARSLSVELILYRTRLSRQSGSVSGRRVRHNDVRDKTANELGAYLFYPLLFSSESHHRELLSHASLGGSWRVRGRD